ncbi:LysR family transcriptional regulator [Pseudomonas sp. S 311-6]|uniref:LysR family transcriptional regulator n=1 Tax=Pseudomonas TaxID=286 RepID=UPI0020983257|nr:MULTISPECIES: LysR family transcriptional regulator [Pseudomonas]MCO7564102.1 LysR family transcriptional regulator [Pseudomonas mosselii]MCO7615399.1 LysR family transcriptional regulator [Pseudomonas guariconensis]MCO7637394.1 LysR family transcriptional regulator [Pseudomonas sp. S 311-6]
MRQDHLDGLVTFLAVAEEKGFSTAAVRLGVSPSAVSQSIRSLEHRLGLVLFNRTTRSVALTEVGERFLERVQPALEALTNASRELGREADHPSGLLRLNVLRASYLIVLQPILRRFLATYPEISLELRVENQLVDIIAQGFDAGIRFGAAVDKDMVALTVGPPLQAQVIAAPDYLARHGRPQHPRALLEHDCIGFRHSSSGQIERWAFSRGNEHFELQVRGRLVLNDSEILVRSALDGLGIAYMINGYIEPFLAQGRLVRLLEDWSPCFPGLQLYYPDRRRVPAKLRALIDFLRAEWAQAPLVEELLS